MSKLAETFQILETTFCDRWSDEVPAEADDMSWYNANLQKQPNDTEWVHFSIQFGDSVNTKNCGGKIGYEQAGTLQLWIYTPDSQGRFRAMEIADQFRSNFANKNIGHVRTRSGFISPLSRTSNWFESRVSIPFFFNDTA